MSIKPVIAASLGFFNLSVSKPASGCAPKARILYSKTSEPTPYNDIDEVRLPRMSPAEQSDTQCAKPSDTGNANFFILKNLKVQSQDSL